MVANHIHHALDQVRELQQKILDKQRFKGYSGRARAISGTLALITAAVMSSPWYPATHAAHLIGWVALFAAAMLLNFGAVLFWFLFDESARRDLRRLKPAADVLPPIFVGGILTLTLIMHGLFRFLGGVWMCMFGLANLAMRHVVPPRIWIPASMYIAAGTIYLLWPQTSFLNPWPMGLAFFLGEWAGGIVLHFDGSEDRTFANFLRYVLNGKVKENVHET